MKCNIILPFMLLAAVSAQGQKIDFNLPGKESQSTENGYESWTVGRTANSEQSFLTPEGNTVTIKAESVAGTEGNAINCNWWKDGTNKYSKLVSDALYPVILDSNNNYSYSASQPMGIQLTISGLSAGEHTITAYHNNTDGMLTPGYPTVKVVVDGVEKASGVEQTIRCQTMEGSGMSYIRFNAVEGKNVVIQYISEPKEGVEYCNTTVALNALIFDRPNPKIQAESPYPENLDMHADADGGSITLSWTPGSSAVKHHVMLGINADEMQEVATVTEASYTASKVSTHNVYYWRIDEEDAAGVRYEGETWSFRPRRIAFPGAEGYGRYAIGGRGGTVYHVTSLDDDVENPQPGTFRYGITKVKGPRTIVFDVSGYITLKGRLTCSDKYVTIAGQTAPGQGVCLRGAPFGMQSDGITRFMRIHRGYAATTEEQDKGLDGFGMAGNDHAIMDHCSIAWTTDEGFSSRGAKSITLQRTMISEALNDADHPNYGSGTRHGYAATIGGGQGYGVGSFHHNLLAHCEGRNWSLSGGLTGSGAYDGAHDVFNNVVYNWGGRATDGGTHELNFVNNYYRKGPATKQNLLLRLQLEGTGKGTQSAYVSGNIREETNGTKTSDKQGTTYRHELSGGQVLDWEPFVTEPFFPSYATIETAEQALRNVLSDVGCNMPFFSEHDRRIVSETLNKTYKYTGSRTGAKGLIDHEADAGGYEIIPEKTRDEAWDTDQDGMPDWWERAKGLDVTVADNNSDYDGNGYTALEEYLNWIALPHYEMRGGETIEKDLAPLFAGYPADAVYTTSFYMPGYDVSINSSALSVTAPAAGGLITIPVTCTENEYSFTRDINIYIIGEGSGIHDVTLSDPAPDHGVIYNVAGQRIEHTAPKSVYIRNGRKFITQ